MRSSPNMLALCPYPDYQLRWQWPVITGGRNIWRSGSGRSGRVDGRLQSPPIAIPSNIYSSPFCARFSNQFVAQPKSHQHKILSIERWTEVFLYTSAYISWLTRRKVKCMHDTRLRAEKYNGWITYEEHSRLRMSINPSKLGRGTRVYSEKGFCTWYCMSINLVQCYEYNNKGTCNKRQCAYAHRCLRVEVQEYTSINHVHITKQYLR